MLDAYRAATTEDQILVPETLLKKRKSQEKQREERSAELEKKKKVSLLFSCFQKWVMAITVMTHFITRLDLCIDVVAYVNHLSGLSYLLSSVTENLRHLLYVRRVC